ncbi:MULTISPECIES: aminotransferase class I/II-fold pyridoxal phosphate-dependent enzyme [Brevibacterium]|uniref:aminotransferase class I/II-fold pyridoxal phosphate-dependent enzyme n=1 Tax=Brevibacterium TaxID=1696 RepID=UPI001EF6FC9D|nr:aminotransferase class I/II-fold pyridoxal phosphate-dependent enzyme [Brevibacterium sp. ACRRH]
MTHHVEITGQSASDIADSVRTLIDRGHLRPGDLLPPVRTLARDLGVNRNTTVAAYRLLATSGLVVGQGRAGTRVADLSPGPQDGYATDGADDNSAEVVDLASGNPLPELIPDLRPALTAAAGHTVLYGEPVIDAGLARWARDWIAPDVPGDSGAPGATAAPSASGSFELSVTSGAVDAIERLLAQSLMRDDAVGLEDPCFLASQQTVRLGGYRTVPIAVDERGMTPAGLQAALEAGVRAVVCTPRAQNPTGASIDAERAQQLREVLADYPYVLVIEDDYYSLLSRVPFESIVRPEHQRWALVRSLSKFIGPDICVALVASDRETAARLALRLSPGTTWVSHLLQRIALAQLTDASARALIEQAAGVYADNNEAFVRALAEHGVHVGVGSTGAGAVRAGDGISVWVPVKAPAAEVAARLTRHGWTVRPGDEFGLTEGGTASRHIRVTVHELSESQVEAFVTDLVLAGGYA